MHHKSGCVMSVMGRLAHLGSQAQRLQGPVDILGLPLPGVDRIEEVGGLGCQQSMELVILPVLIVANRPPDVHAPRMLWHLQSRAAMAVTKS